jgi:hypothetical protein
MAEQQEHKDLVDKQIKKYYKILVKEYLKKTNTPTFLHFKNWAISQNPKFEKDVIFHSFIEQVYSICVTKRKNKKI